MHRIYIRSSRLPLLLISLTPGCFQNPDPVDAATGTGAAVSTTGDPHDTSATEDVNETGDDPTVVTGDSAASSATSPTTTDTSTTDTTTDTETTATSTTGAGTPNCLSGGDPGHLEIEEATTYDFGLLPGGGVAEAVLHVTPTEGLVATNVMGKISGDGVFAFKGGAYPGTGGTCSDMIDAPCEVVVEFTPKAGCKFFGILSLDYSSGSIMCEPVSVGLKGQVELTGDLNDTCEPGAVLYVSPAGNDANDGKSPAAAFKTIGAATKTGSAEVRIAAGTYHEQVKIAHQCVHLMGGWNPNFTVRDPDVYISTIETAANNTSTVYVVQANAVVDGLVLVESVGSQGASALASVQSHTIVRGCKVHGKYDGMDLVQSCAVVANSEFTGDERGAYIVQSQVWIESNTFEGGKSGARLGQVWSSTIKGNTFHGSSHGLQTVQLGPYGPVHLTGNRITGLDTGVDETQSKWTKFSNNLIYGAARGINVTQSHELRILHNVIGAEEDVVALTQDDCSIILDNIFFSLTGEGVGIDGSCGVPIDVENNVFANVVSAYKGLAAEQLNELDGSDSCVCPGLAQISGNRSTALDLDEIFVALKGADEDLMTPGDNNAHLLTSDTTITWGGKSTTENTCGPKGANLSCGNIIVDYDGDPRSAPVSIGLDEK
jgi:hypothetical protein